MHPLLRVAVGLFVLGLLLGGATRSFAQADFGMCPPGSTPVYGGGGTMCQCPDGSYAGIQGCSGGYSPRPQGNYCPSGGVCPYGTTCCGTQCCNQGARCTPSGGCIPERADDCGGGQWCSEGTQCWRAPESIGSLQEGQLTCATPSQVADLERAIADRREAERRQQLEARRADAENQASQLRQKQQQNSVAQKQAGDQMQQSLERQRQLDLQKSAKLNQERLRRPGNVGESCDARKIQAIADGLDPNKVVCGAAPAQGTQARAQPNASSTQDKAWTDQLDYLKRNTVRLQPEERKVPPTAAPPPADLKKSTVTGFEQEITPTSELGRLLQKEAERRERAREEEEARSAPERKAAYEKYLQETRKEQARQQRIDDWNKTHFTETEQDESDCQGLHRLSPARKTECAAKGQVGATSCRVCQVNKLCERHFWGKHCEVQSVSCESVCR